jgi:prepilin-type N-terminal cleavage/methylation domain-containing protein/prepilin-type processing-associated H-X9-DG protein
MAGRNRGFTLIEILVVVAIIALLLAILLPSLGRAKEVSRQVVCESNLHQFGIALQMYVDKYRCFVPFSTEKGEWGRWPRLIGETRSLRNSTANIRHGLVQLATCPTVPERSRALKLTNHKMDRDIAYGYNYIYLGDSRWLWKGGARRWPFSATHIKYPGQTIAIADSDGTGGWCPQPSPYNPEGSDGNAIGHHGFMIDPPALPEDVRALGPAYDPAKCPLSSKPGFSRLAARHRGGTSVLWVDGHVTWKLRDHLERDNSPWNGRRPEP